MAGNDAFEELQQNLQISLVHRAVAIQILVARAGAEGVGERHDIPVVHDTVVIEVGVAGVPGC